MKVPYAKKRQNETDEPRKIVLDCDLVEELKWGKPCFTYQKKNVAIIIPLKDACALSFFKGVLLKDPKGLFAIQHVAPIIDKAVLAAHGPRLAQVIDAVSAKLTTTAMRRMNGAVDLDGRKPREVATEFLRSQGLL